MAEQLTQPPRRKGDRIGSYEVERLIGSGGGGDVYLAHQQRPSRLVAIKVMRHGLVDPTRERRFEFEAQLLARLQHPGIAQVFEVDVFEDRGQRKPFFVMEYVEDPDALTAYAERAELSPRARLELFASVCEAIGYGHHPGVVHCDLKPDNVLVPPSGNFKVIDFGIARAADRDAGKTTQHSAYSLAGTLPYMSPEQATGAPDGLDSRTDVYSLGVICFELLSGQLPLDVAGVSIPTATHRIAMTEPDRLGIHGPTFRGDLEIITARCLEKDRERRYSDAIELARDVRRYLADEPIVARRPTAAYQLRMFARRHRGLVTGTTLAVLALFVGAAVAVQQAVLARRGEVGSRWQTYRASIAAASAALANHDVAQARISLDGAPEEHRNWEWRHLDANPDGSFSSIELPGGGMAGRPVFLTSESGDTVGVVCDPVLRSRRTAWRPPVDNTQCPRLPVQYVLRRHRHVRAIRRHRDRAGETRLRDRGVTLGGKGGLEADYGGDGQQRRTGKRHAGRNTFSHRNGRRFSMKG